METIKTTTVIHHYGDFEKTSVTYISTDEELEKLHTKQLLKILGGIRAEKSKRANTLGQRCCEVCNEYVGGDWEKEVKPHLDICDQYINRIKAVLSKRPHVPNKQESKRLRKNKIKKGR